ncbi:MAG: class I SAM-dependent methyltransferase [Bacteroidia bacterium]
MYGLKTGKVVVHNSESQFPYQACAHYVLNKVFDQIKPYLDYQFIDIGCGKGRVLLVAQKYGFSSIIGIEMSKELTTLANIEIDKFGQSNSKVNIQAFCENAIYFDYPNRDSVVFLFNPFDANMLEKSLNTLLQKNKKEIILVYVNPVFSEIIGKFPFRKLNKVKTNFYTEAIIYRRIT